MNFRFRIEYIQYQLTTRNVMKSVLIIDDDPLIVELYKDQIELLNHQALIAANGLEAFNILKTNTPDLIIVDLLMPGMNGIDFLKKIHQTKRLRPVPILVVSGVQNNALLRKSVELGAIGFLQKPFDINLLRVKIASLVRFSGVNKEHTILFDGRLEEKQLEGLIIAIESRGVTGWLTMENEERIGKIKFSKGILDFAQLENLEESAALDELMSWKKGMYCFDQNDRSPEITTDQQEEYTPQKEPTKNAVSLDRLEIADKVYHLGEKNSNFALNSNIYLKIYNTDKAVVINPGVEFEYKEFATKTNQILGAVAHIQKYILSSYAPNNSQNAIHLQSANSNMVCFTSEANWNMLAGNGIKKAKVICVETLQNGQIKLEGDKVLQVIPINYCPTYGTFAVYDIDTRVLFSGPLFSGMMNYGNAEMYANEGSWEAIKRFHQIYMPSHKALQNALNKIKALKPAPLLIAPLYGDVISGKYIDLILNKLTEIQVGPDCTTEVAPKDKIYTEMAQHMYKKACSITGEGTHILSRLRNDSELQTLMRFDDNGVRDILSNGPYAYERLSSLIFTHIEDAELASQVKSFAIEAAINRQFTPPQI